jgi:hypothetical protein
LVDAKQSDDGTYFGASNYSYVAAQLSLASDRVTHPAACFIFLEQVGNLRLASAESLSLCAGALHNPAFTRLYAGTVLRIILAGLAHFLQPRGHHLDALLTGCRKLCIVLLQTLRDTTAARLDLGTKLRDVGLAARRGGIRARRSAKPDIARQRRSSSY